MKPVRLLIFDLDGTLVDTLDDIASSVNHTLAAFNREGLPRDLVRRYVGDGIEALLSRAFGGPDRMPAEAAEVYKAHHRANLAVRSALYPPVQEALERFKAIPLAIISNKAEEFVRPLVERLGIAGYFRVIIGADHGLPLKPAPDSVLAIMRRCGAPPDKTVIVGDGTTDVRAGKAAGVMTCSVTCGFRSEEELRSAGPDFVIPDLSGLASLFAPEAS